MSGYPLMSVLELRRREENAALERLAVASRARTEAEAEEERCLARVTAAGQRYDAAQRTDIAPATTSVNDGAAFANGASATEHARFRARRRDEFAHAESTLAAFRAGPLTRARAAEETARTQHLDARRARETFEKHEAKFREAQRRAIERREEDASDDMARQTMPSGVGRRQP